MDLTYKNYLLPPDEERSPEFLLEEPLLDERELDERDSEERIAEF